MMEPIGAQKPADGRPPYFHLLWDHELEGLAPVLDAVLARRDEVLSHWYGLYVLHFGDTRSLSERDFMDIFSNDLAASIGDLRRGDIQRFTVNVRRVGEALAARRVPFSEIIVSMHLFEESASRVFPLLPPVTGKTYLAFDKLSHCRMILLADAYFRSTQAIANARIRDLEREAAKLPQSERTRFHGLVGGTPVMRVLYQRIEAAAATRGTILVVGESGTGKELVARAIHECSAAVHAPFVALNCAAIPRDLIESELFGYKRGAFSGAIAEHLGLFRSAQDGTIFLDEITEMDSHTQSKLLRALQEHTVRPVGSSVEVPIEVKLIASTNRDPEEALREGRLRSDLYYRLQANIIRIAPLRDRREDIPILVEHFINLFNEQLKRPRPISGIADDALAAMKAYDWPGNVRELSNALEGAFTFSSNTLVTLADLPEPISGQNGLKTGPGSLELSSTAIPTFADVERDLVARALANSDGNKVKAAKLLRISRKKLYATIDKYGLG